VSSIPHNPYRIFHLIEKELAWAHINRGETVPTVLLRLKIQATSRSFSYEEVKEFSQKNRETRFNKSGNLVRTGV